MKERAPRGARYKRKAEVRGELSRASQMRNTKGGWGRRRLVARCFGRALFGGGMDRLEQGSRPY